jgi:AbrB family looped-hinge helix DNA binding protein
MAVQEPIFTVSEQLVQMRQRGQVTIPADLRRNIGLRDGDTFSAIQIGESIMLVRKKLVVPELAEKMRQILAEEGVTLDELLADLDAQRTNYHRTRHGGQA